MDRRTEILPVSSLDEFRTIPRPRRLVRTDPALRPTRAVRANTPSPATPLAATELLPHVELQRRLGAGGHDAVLEDFKPTVLLDRLAMAEGKDGRRRSAAIAAQSDRDHTPAFPPLAAPAADYFDRPITSGIGQLIGVGIIVGLWLQLVLLPPL